MSKKKKDTEIVDDLDGTVEGLARDRFEQEKAAYEERTGEKVQFVPPAPETRTPIKSDQEAVSSEQLETGKELTKLTRAELVDQASGLGLEIEANAKKADIIAAIENHIAVGGEQSEDSDETGVQEPEGEGTE